LNPKLGLDSIFKPSPENGLITGEGYLLRTYAHEIGFAEKDWP